MAPLAHTDGKQNAKRNAKRSATGKASRVPNVLRAPTLTLQRPSATTLATGALMGGAAVALAVAAARASASASPAAKASASASPAAKALVSASRTIPTVPTNQTKSANLSSIESRMLKGGELRRNFDNWLLKTTETIGSLPGMGTASTIWTVLKST